MREGCWVTGFGCVEVVINKVVCQGAEWQVSHGECQGPE